MFNNSLNVRRKISAGGANQGAFLQQEIQLNLFSVALGLTLIPKWHNFYCVRIKWTNRPAQICVAYVIIELRRFPT